jgi:hypothetical protein
MRKLELEDVGKKIKRVIDYQPSPVQTFGKANWAEYEVEVEFEDGSTAKGFLQGDTHMWAFETFEYE